MSSMHSNTGSYFSVEQLRRLELVVQLGSFTLAAGQLGLTQPAVSQQIRVLERQLGVRLLERFGRTVVPTSAGLDLLKHLPHINAAMESAYAAVSAYADDVMGTIRIGAGATNCLYLLPTVLGRLRQVFPKVRLIISTGNTDDLVRRVEDNALDIALVTLPVSSQLVSPNIILEDEIVAIRQRDAGSFPDRVDAPSLIGMPLIMLSAGTSTRGLIDAWFASHGIKPIPEMELDSVEAIKAVVASGAGCSLLPRMAVMGTGHHPDLDVSPVFPPLHRTQVSVTRHDKTMTAALRVVMNAIASEGKRLSGAAAGPAQ